jgi:PAS domain-containing protein
MNRRPVEVAVSVFVFSVISELVRIRILRGSLTVWLHHPQRRLLLLSIVLVNLLNAATALYFSARAVRAEVSLHLNEEKQRESGLYLNHQLRNALSVIQDAAFLINDEQTVKLCDEAVTRIANVPVSSHSGVRRAGLPPGS